MAWLRVVPLTLAVVLLASSPGAFAQSPDASVPLAPADAATAAAPDAAPTPVVLAPAAPPAAAEQAALPPIVAASPPPRPPIVAISVPEADRERARAAYRRGFELMIAERWREAAAELDRSYAALPMQLTLIHLALCLERLARDDEAIAKLREFQERFGEQSSAERRAAVDRALARLASRDPRVAVRASVRGAMIRVDGRDIGRTPLLVPLSLRPGGHSIAASHPGRVTVVRHVLLLPFDRREVVLDLAPAR